MREISTQFLDNIKFAAECAIKDPDSIYAQEFFMLLDETFGKREDYRQPVQAVAVSWLIDRVKYLEQRAEAAFEVQRLNATEQPVSDGWMKCSDRLPLIGDEVLIRIPVCGSHNIENGKYKGEGKFIGAWCDNRGEGCAYAVSEWMPLPAAPGG